MSYKIITLPRVSFIQVLKTVKYGSAALHETRWWSSRSYRIVKFIYTYPSNRGSE